ncbi:Squalene epoxidase [Polyrhizophydium stewartii]|uniref:Squalene monooxygenase n=1 Tax=Polyrhizophydium stewartii TaxID=2732419 RepID=A0ABR4N8E6_9FUNG
MPAATPTTAAPAAPALRPVPSTLPADDTFDVIVIGAGIAGCAAAHALGNDGRRVLVIERDWREPDRIVGELLQPGGVHALELLGLRDCIDGIDGIDCHGYAVIKTNGEEVVLPYPADKQPNTGRSLHHGRLIMNLRRAAQNAQNVTCIEGTASELVTDPKTGVNTGVLISTKTSDKPVLASAPLTVVADGCFSKFRKQFISRDTVCKSHFVGFIIRDCPLPHMNHGHVVLAKPSPILLYQIGSHETRILVDVPGKLPSIGSGEMKAYMRDFVGPQLPPAVQPSFFEALETERFRSMPNSWLPPTRNTGEGVFLLGDIMNMRHPLTGGGMTVAFWDVVRLRDALRSVSDLSQTAVVRSRLGALHWQRKRLSSVINILANALYALFSAGDDPMLLQLQTACFAYFKLGGRCVSTPVGLLAGLIQEPMTLIGHFFAVAIYGTFLMWIQGPFYMFPVNFVRSFVVLFKACAVIFPLIGAELRP